MQHNKLFHKFVLVCALFLWGVQQEGVAQSQTDELQQIEKDIQKQKQQSNQLKSKSESLKKEAVALRAELIALSQSVQQREANVTRLEDSLAIIKLDENQARLALEERHGQSVETLMALQRLALNPPEAIIALPQPPADMVRSAILLRSIVPQIQEQATVLRREVTLYAQKRKQLEVQKEQLSLANVNLDDERRRLNALISEKKKLSKRFLTKSRNAQKRIASLSKKAKSLRSLIDKINREKKAQAARVKKAKPASRDVRQERDVEIVLGKPPSGKPIAKAKGKLSRPASGKLVMKFGQREKLGGKHKGVSFKTRRGAQIVATYDGQIAFAGPFRGYKQLLIIDHGGGYHTLLTGMDRIDVSVGQWLLSGEPVGIMSQSRSGRDTLYFELRKNGAPINPSSWMRRQNARARG
ncbi:putative Peptidase M23B [Candidatus Terasakiella magnetica]|uniref:Putative Peptidase M23B n=1 Tax=Candidatus Terasakiella magnetica TaxID=1867952 RepID=A0A1C3REL8_9PROT|nr:peptidoglycan DD-metalloendopeptidase family protein [Candidatus Terasakiella magnetica]SCA55682.1 putative Peptidase M23B [Candidatus Terasakiella magnetica]